ncbi:hypothetical protein H7K28_06890 [Paenibacillus polymyxa]|jgi:predicted RNase H-like nuclease (RuvC/YqgF family)|uniref:hypothetical protein n=1 Tax=Paenibacillus polymyxa TaxID=1406 RepID=UPI00157FDC5C|nr:hypothetical protein [Paenibacillus polymyxa]MBY0020758.1 hypothetical protein [Paenibacillus polymyxa]MBY0059062.1 hypothetical protein [Paenibacillus polymyxa]MBY0069649.1 hypothetical protein [Paenibacillus polymyxa]MBY0083266.1 hypothetical protein [Paenibacillus polymyxa]MBZ6441834.1 hypothetical protein [Paenibacillus polymyxa]
MSERTVDLIRTDLQSAKNEAKKNILLPVREVEDVLALVDSLQQQVKKLSEYKVSSNQFGELYDKAISVVRQNESNKKKADDNYRALLEETIQLRDQLAEMRRERDRTIAEVREVLEFYAENGNYREHIIGWGPEIPVIKDGGRRARKSLAG